MSETLRRVIQTRAGGRVERCHGIVHHGSYSNAAHSWGVAMLMYALWPADFRRLALVCLAHDVPEAWVGDIPAPTKRYGKLETVPAMEAVILGDLGLPDDRDLVPMDRAKVKNCDQLELYIWTREQAVMGNLFADEIRIELEQFWRETPLLPEAEELRQQLQRRNITPQMSGVVRELMTGEST